MDFSYRKQARLLWASSQTDLVDFEQIISSFYNLVYNEVLPPLRETKKALEIEIMKCALRKSEGSTTKAAALLNMNRSTFVERIKKDLRY